MILTWTQPHSPSQLTKIIQNTFEYFLCSYQQLDCKLLTELGPDSGIDHRIDLKFQKDDKGDSLASESENQSFLCQMPEIDPNSTRRSQRSTAALKEQFQLLQLMDIVHQSCKA